MGRLEFITPSPKSYSSETPTLNASTFKPQSPQPERPQRKPPSPNPDPPQPHPQIPSPHEPPKNPPETRQDQFAPIFKAKLWKVKAEGQHCVEGLGFSVSGLGFGGMLRGGAWGFSSRVEGLGLGFGV